MPSVVMADAHLCGTAVYVLSKQQTANIREHAETVFVEKKSHSRQTKFRRCEKPKMRLRS